MHRFEASGRARRSPPSSRSKPELDVSDARLIEQGFEVLTGVRPARPSSRRSSADVAGPGEIKVETWPMSSYVMTRVRMGERSGYTSGWCDAPHWGLVTRRSAGHRMGGRRRDPLERATSSIARPDRRVIASRRPTRRRSST